MIACVDIICGVLLAFVRTREVGVSSLNVVSRTFPHFSQSMLTPAWYLHVSKRKGVSKELLQGATDEVEDEET